MSKKADFRLEKFDEYDEACQMTSLFCDQISQDEFEEQGATETEKALEELLEYLDKNPVTYKTLLKKRKREEKENEGFMSALKLKVMGFIHGDSNYGIEVTNEECEDKLDKLKSEMQRAFDYSLKSKGRRCSERLAAKRGRTKKTNDENTPLKNMAPPPPPPPPPPIPDIVPSVKINTPGGRKHSGRSLSDGTTPSPRRALGSPLRDINNQMNTPQSLVKPRNPKRGSLSSMTSMSTIGSLSSLHQEIIEFNPLKRLKSVKDLSRSPGGTPARKKKRGSGSPSSFGGPGTPTEPLYRALVNSMQKKFRNVRSPSPAGALYNNAMSPASASTSPGFTP